MKKKNCKNLMSQLETMMKQTMGEHGKIMRRIKIMIWKEYLWKFSAKPISSWYFMHYLPFDFNTLFGKIGSELLFRSEEEYEDYEDDYEEEDCGDDGYCTYSEVTWKTIALLNWLLFSYFGICIFQLHFVSNIKVINMKKYSREIC